MVEGAKPQLCTRIVITKVSEWMLDQNPAVAAGQEYDVIRSFRARDGQLSDVEIMVGDVKMLVHRTRLVVVEPWAGDYAI